MDSRRAQGSFEYVLMLSGVLLVVITMVFLLQGTTSSANNTVGNTMKTAGTMVDPSYYIPGAKPVFVPPTPADGAWGASQPNISAIITLTNAQLTGLSYGWNATNYSFYDPSLVLSTGLDDNPAIGETASEAVDVSQYGNNGTIYDNTLGLWHLDEGTGRVAIDESGYRANLTCAGGAGDSNCNWSAGESGSGVSFDGVQSYLYSHDVTRFKGLSQLTVSLWVKKSSSIPHGGPIEIGVFPASTQSLSVLDDSNGGIANDSIAISVSNGAAYYSLLTSHMLPLNQWTHLAIVFKGGSFLKAYINGNPDTQTASVPSSLNANPASFIRMGQYSGNFFNGTVDEVAIYGRSLSDSEIAALYSAGRAKHDSWTPNGKWNSAMSLDGVHDYVDCGNSSSLNINGNITVQAWVRSSSPNTPGYGHQAFVSKGGLVDSYVLYRYDDGSTMGPVFRIQGVGGVGGPANTLPQNTWTYLAGTYNGTNMYFYENGVSVGSQAASGTFAKTPNDLRIGDCNGACRANGSIDEVRVWNRALSGQEIAVQYASDLYKYDNNTWYFDNYNTNLPVGGYSYALYTNSTNTFNPGPAISLVSDSRTVHVCSTPFVPC